MYAMTDWSPADVPIPAFLDPVLEYIRSVVPPPLYTFLLTILSHTLALLTTFFALASSLLSTKPWEWDAQTLLPPIISLLAAYLALVSLYRTTTWAIRTSIWFIKWGLILAVFMGGTGWLIGVTKGLVPLGARNLTFGFGDLVLDLFNGQGRNSASNLHDKSRTRKKGSQTPRGRRPKPWESFDSHRKWRQGLHDADQQGDAQKYIADIVGAAGSMIKGSRWWEAAKGAVDGVGQQEADNGVRKGKTTVATGKSSRPR